MFVSRHFELSVQRIYREGRMPGFVHLYVGEEAVAAGVSAHLQPGDKVGSTHRGHAHALVVGMPPRELMAELFGRETGCCAGRGGSMHLFSKEHGLLGCNGIVGYGIPIAAGTAFADKYLGRPNVSIAFFGDGATNLGIFHEVLNMATIWTLPVVFVCENNKYATELSADYAIAGNSVAKRAVAYDLPGEEVDGQDVLAVYEAAGKAIERARSGEGPSLIECLTYRYLGHHEGDPGTDYRTQEEIDEWKNRDPIDLFTALLFENEIATEQELEKVRQEIEEEVAEAEEFGENSPWPSPETLGAKVFSNPL
jgi:pyruvate dehydrogenase E1 component alpha subunit